jgi:hypothetical protein
MAAAQEPGNVAVASVLDADYYGKEEYEPKYEHKGEYEPKYHSEYEKKDYGYGKASDGSDIRSYMCCSVCWHCMTKAQVGSQTAGRLRASERALPGASVCRIKPEV